MSTLRRIGLCKWGLGTLAAVFLSQCFKRWNAFTQAPAGPTYAGILAALTLFLLLMAALAVVVYAEEKARGRITVKRPLLERLSNRFFSNPDEHEAR